MRAWSDGWAKDIYVCSYLATEPHPGIDCCFLLPALLGQRIMEMEMWLQVAGKDEMVVVVPSFMQDAVRPASLLLLSNLLDLTDLHQLIT